MLFIIYEFGPLGSPGIINKSLTYESLAGFVQAYLVTENAKLVIPFQEYR